MISQTEFECPATEERRLARLRRLQRIVFAVGVACLVAGITLLLLIVAMGVMA